jgi:uncharacterized protein YkwD
MHDRIRMRSTALRLAPLLVAAALAGPAALPAPAVAGGRCTGAGSRPNPARTAALSRTTLCLLNRQRADHGLAALRGNSHLALAAWRHSRDMVVHNFFAHGDVLGRLARAGYLRGRRSWSVGENIAWGSGSSATPRAIVSMWMHSPGHRANILNGRFHEIGVGLVAGAPVPRVRGAATYTTDFGGG